MQKLAHAFLNWLKGKPKTWQDLSESERLKIREATVDTTTISQSGMGGKPKLKGLPTYYYMGYSRGSIIWDIWGNRKRSPGTYDMYSSDSNESAQIDSVRKRRD